jgi:hypothetical protein
MEKIHGRKANRYKNVPNVMILPTNRVMPKNYSLPITTIVRIAIRPWERLANQPALIGNATIVTSKIVT